MLDIIFNTIGLIGVAFLLYAFFLLQAGKITGEDMIYPVTNLVGALLLLVSLMWSWNLSSVIIELCWAAISIYGIFKILKDRKK